MVAWYRQHQTETALSRLDDRQLADIGIRRVDIATIARAL
jgi:uncharacterized protein YjiS (DUF1127 family)